MRGVVSDRQQPITQQQIFLRADASDAFVEHLELGAFSLIDAYDGSELAQAYASYNISDNWTAGAYFSGELGSQPLRMGQLFARSQRNISGDEVFLAVHSRYLEMLRKLSPFRQSVMLNRRQQPSRT